MGRNTHTFGYGPAPAQRSGVRPVKASPAADAPSPLSPGAPARTEWACLAPAAGRARSKAVKRIVANNTPAQAGWRCAWMPQERADGFDAWLRPGRHGVPPRTTQRHKPARRLLHCRCHVHHQLFTCCPCPCTRQPAADATTQPMVLRHHPTWFCARFLADSGIMNSLAWPSLWGARKFAG